MTQVTLKLMDPSPYLYTKGQKRERKRRFIMDKSSVNVVTDQDHTTRLSVQVPCNNATRLIDKPICRVWVRSVSRLKDPTSFLDCRDSLPLKVRI